MRESVGSKSSKFNGFRRVFFSVRSARTTVGSAGRLRLAGGSQQQVGRTRSPVARLRTAGANHLFDQGGATEPIVECAAKHGFAGWRSLPLAVDHEDAAKATRTCACQLVAQVSMGFIPTKAVKVDGSLRANRAGTQFAHLTPGCACDTRCGRVCIGSGLRRDIRTRRWLRSFSGAGRGDRGQVGAVHRPYIRVAREGVREARFVRTGISALRLWILSTGHRLRLPRSFPYPIRLRAHRSPPCRRP